MWETWETSSRTSGPGYGGLGPGAGLTHAGLPGGLGSPAYPRRAVVTEKELGRKFRITTRVSRVAEKKRTLRSEMRPSKVCPEWYGSNFGWSLPRANKSSVSESVRLSFGPARRNLVGTTRGHEIAPEARI